jgi:hypothetical protein
MKRTEDEFRKNRWVDMFFLTCYVFLGGALFYMTLWLK